MRSNKYPRKVRVGDILLAKRITNVYIGHDEDVRKIGYLSIGHVYINDILYVVSETRKRHQHDIVSNYAYTACIHCKLGLVTVDTISSDGDEYGGILSETSYTLLE